MSWFTELDLHVKIDKDFAVRTRSGGLVSLLALLIACTLFLSELRTYLSVEKVEHMEVDDAAAGGFRGGSAVTDKIMRVNFDVTFPSLPCALLSLDAMDASGANSVDVIHNVFKRRLNAEGFPLGDGVKEGALDTLRSAEELLKEKRRAIAEGRPVAKLEAGQCGDCYGAAEAGVCCNTCEEVREAYKKKGWGFVMKGVSQCEVEGFYGDVQTQLTNVRCDASRVKAWHLLMTACAVPSPPPPLCSHALAPPPPPPPHPTSAEGGLQRVRLFGGAEGAGQLPLWALAGRAVRVPARGGRDCLYVRRL
jgi:hypothetical protein